MKKRNLYIGEAPNAALEVLKKETGKPYGRIAGEAILEKANRYLNGWPTDEDLERADLEQLQVWFNWVSQLWIEEYPERFERIVARIKKLKEKK